MNKIVQRQLDATRAELKSMNSELSTYRDQFKPSQRFAMVEAMGALQKLIAVLEDHKS